MSTGTEDNCPDTHQDHLRCHIIREEHSYCSVATQCYWLHMQSHGGWVCSYMKNNTVTYKHMESGLC